MSKSIFPVSAEKATELFRSLADRFYPFGPDDYMGFEGADAQYHPEIATHEGLGEPLTVVSSDLGFITFFYGEELDHCQVFYQMSWGLTEVSDSLLKKVKTF
jgi:hypothetical protein